MGGKVDIVFGGNVGSEGKGKFAGFLALKKNYKHVVANFFPNTGHTWVSDEGEEVVTSLLPTSLVNMNTNLYIGPGAALNLKTLFKEIEMYDPRYNIKERLYIHPRAAIVEEFHIQEELHGPLKKSGSTFKGGGAAFAYKAMRRTDVQKLAWDVEELQGYIHNTEILLNNALEKGEDILIEGSQGFDLDINYGIKYPHTTSRQTTPAQLLADSGLPIYAVRDIFAILRAYPIRIANPLDGDSGIMPSDEISWEELKKISNTPQHINLTELTTVTKKERRISKPSIERMKYMIKLTRPSAVFLNFINHINFEDSSKKNYEELSIKSKVWIDTWEQQLGIDIKFLGTGRRNSEIIER